MGSAIDGQLGHESGELKADGADVDTVLKKPAKSFRFHFTRGRCERDAGRGEH
jgi:hypothetical protein